MMVLGVWHDNITCPKCRFRHPAILTCKLAKAHAEAAREEAIKRRMEEAELDSILEELGLTDEE